MPNIFNRFAKSIAVEPNSAYVVWTSKADAIKNGADYDAGQSILTTWCEWLDSNSERVYADTLRYLNKGAAKAITLPNADPAFWNRLSAIHAAVKPAKRRGKDMAADQGDGYD